ncbi:MAG: hypothetical protein KME21_06420 [Desmonostoc vinosum HA7617-LM4]|jgi:hypothetical protein|nr:hypothetical protein [Desmonostoc vinosum HA7617-LM4]
MSQITISTLHTAGSDLFSDSESYLKDLSEKDLNIQGGIMHILLMEVSGSIITVASAFLGVGIGAATSYAYAKYKTIVD